MDIWRWVNEVQDDLAANGRRRLADLISVIPSYVVNHKHAQLDAIVPEALALCREAKNPWLEVFVRHWNLQSRILHRHEVRSFLPEAVRLIEFASRDETRECPQSVCVTQDIAGCYAKIDGPGYVPERLSVAGETLGRIDARWPCFTCIASEYALALIDRGDAALALAFLEEKAQDLATVGRARAAHHLSSARIEAWLRLGHFEEALAAARAAKESSLDENDRVSHALDCAFSLARLGRREEALAELPSFDRALPTPSLYERWSQTAFTLALGAAIENDFKLDAQLFEMQTRLHTQGVIRMTADLIERRARLALARGRIETAEECEAELRSLLPELRAPLEVGEALAALRRDLAEAQALAPPRSGVVDEVDLLADTPEAVLRKLGADPERDLALLREARRRFPDDERLLLVEASALQALRRGERAEAKLRTFLAEHPDAESCLMTLGELLLEKADPGAARALAQAALRDGQSPETEASAHWLIALSHQTEGSPHKARPHIERVLALRPGSVDIELLLATLDREAGALSAAMERLDRLVEERPAPGNHDWERMVVATLLERWDKVRESARRVGMKLEGEGPIDEAWAICQIEFVEPDGGASIQHALRTGPVTARIIEVARPRTPQHYGDEVVFKASPKNPPPAPGEEKTHTYLYPVLQVRRPGGYEAFLIDGVHPGEAALAELTGALSALGCTLSLQSDAAYEIHAPEGGAPLPGLFAYLAVPRDRPLAEVHALLDARAQSYAYPLIWPSLAQAIGLEEELARQAEIIDRYEL
jgi:tetratricopeptide (TPR) repeat protein